MERVESFKSRFQSLQDAFVISKSKHYSKWTIPYLMGEPNRDGMQHALEGDFQSVGSLLVNSLASKMSGLLYPTTHPFMSLELTSEGRRALDDVAEQSGESVSQVLSRLVSAASGKAFSGKSFFQLVTALKHLIVTGNVAIYRDAAEDAIVCYGLRNFVTRRDGLGRVVEAIIKEDLFFGTLPDDVQQYLVANGNYGTLDDTLRDRVVEKFTRIRLDGLTYVEEQGIDDVILPDTFTTVYEKHRLPYVFPTWTLLNGEHYGRGLVEDLKGDFAKLSEISEALTLYEIEAARVVYLVSAESFDAIDDLVVADTGDWVRASHGAVSVFETGSAQKIEYLMADLEVVFNRLARAMMWRANTRGGDRITAFEIRQEIQEVEASMGGAYSALAESMQLPLSMLFLFEVDEGFMQAIMDLDVGSVHVTTGINALGKSTKAQSLLEVLMEAGSIMEIAQMDQRIDTTKIMDLLFEARGLDFQEISKSEEQLEEEAQAAVQMQEAQVQQQEGAMLGQMGNEMGGI